MGQPTRAWAGLGLPIKKIQQIMSISVCDSEDDSFSQLDVDEDDDDVLCVGSKRSGSSSQVFQTPQNDEISSSREGNSRPGHKRK